MKTLRLELPEDSGVVIKNIAGIFKRQVESRCDAKVLVSGKAPLTVELAVEPGIGSEGFRIADGKDGVVRILGNDERGVLYGVGKFGCIKINSIARRIGKTFFFQSLNKSNLFFYMFGRFSESARVGDV